MADISEWFKNIPKLTKFWFTLTVLFSILGKFIIPQYYLILQTELVYRKLQIWRPITAVFYYPLNGMTGFHFMLNLFFLYNYSLRLETEHFKGKNADYFFLLFFNWACCAIVGFLFHLPLLMDPMIISVLYVWCQLNKNVIVNFWFGTRFKAMYLPWILFLIDLVLSDSGFFPLMGIFIGHLYFFLKFKYPQELGGRSFLETPRFFRKYLPDSTENVHGFGGPINRANVEPPRVGGEIWGRGNVLGRE